MPEPLDLVFSLSSKQELRIHEPLMVLKEDLFQCPHHLNWHTIIISKLGPVALDALNLVNDEKKTLKRAGNALISQGKSCIKGIQVACQCIKATQTCDVPLQPYST